MKKIVLVTGESTLSGAPTHVLRLALNLKLKGYQVLVILPPGPLINKLKSEEIDYKEIPMGNWVDRTAYHEIKKQISIFNPDIVHCHGMRGGLLCRLATRKTNYPVVYTEHLWTKEYHLNNRTYEKIQLASLKFLDRYTVRTIAVSDAVKDFLVSNGFESGKIDVVTNSVNPVFHETNVLKKPAGMPIIFGSVGSLNRQKNYINVLKAIAKVKKDNSDLMFHYQIIGDGPDRKKLEMIAQRLKIEDNVHFVGRVDQVWERLKHFSFFVMVSFSESFGLAAAEAMAVGLPLIVSRVGGLVDVVDEKSAIVVDPRSTKEIADAIYRLATDTKLRDEMSASAKIYAKDKFCEKSMTEKIIKIYEQVTKNN